MRAESPPLSKPWRRPWILVVTVVCPGDANGVKVRATCLYIPRPTWPGFKAHSDPSICVRIIYIYYYAEAANSGQNHTVKHNTAHSYSGVYFDIKISARHIGFDGVLFKL